MSSAHAGSWTTFMGHDTVAVPPKLSVAESDSYFVAVQADIYGVTRADTTVDDTTYTILTVPEYGYTTEVGKPMVPVVTVLVAVPDSVDISLSLAAYDYTTMEDIIIYPVPKESTSCDTCCCFEVFTKDSATYNTDTFYPGTLAELDTSSHMRSQRIAQIRMYPIQFNPVDSVVRAYHYFRPELTLTGSPVENTHGLGPFEEIGRQCLLNYKGDSSFVSDTTGDVHIITDPKDTTTIADYLIVIADSLWGHGDYDSLAEWRADHNYFDVGFVKLKKIMKAFCPDDTLYYPAPDDECLKDFFEYAYEHYRTPQMPDSHFGYVLLVGDVVDPDTVSMMPTHYEPMGSDSFASDVWYSCLDGESDRYPEFAIGRFTVQDTANELDTVALKTWEYEHSPDTTDWRRDVLIAYGEPDGEFWAERMVGIFSPLGYDTFMAGPDLDTLWDDTLFAYLDSGKVVASYRGHGDCFSWCGPKGGIDDFQVDEVKALGTGLKLPFTLAAACLTGKFDIIHFDCIGEAFLKQPGSGAVAYVGASKIAATGDIFLEAISRAIMDDQQWLVGNAILEGRLRFGYREYNLLGDPAVDIGDYTAFPDKPDLVIRSKHITLGPDYPSLGDTLTIQARVFNIGSGEAEDVVVTVLDSCQQQGSTIGVDTIPSLGPREDTLLEVAWCTAPDTAYDIGTHKIVIVVDSDSTIDESWEKNNSAFITERIFFYPNEDGWPQKTGGAIRSSPALADLFDDSKFEIVIGSDDHCLYAFPASGDLGDGWVDTTGAPIFASPIVGDINNDDSPEVIVAVANSLCVWDATGDVLTNWPIELCDTSQFAYTAASADVDGDDTLDIIVPAGTTVYVLRYDTTSVSGWPVAVASEVQTLSAPGVADIDSDDDLEIFVTADQGFFRDCYVHAWDDGGTALSGWPPDTTMSGEVCVSPALANLDGSGDWEIMAGLGERKMYAWTSSGSAVSGLWPVATATNVTSSPAVGDFDPASSGYEIIAGCAADTQGNGRVYAWDREGNSISEYWPRLVDGDVRSSPGLANIDSSSTSPNTLLDVVVGTMNGYVYAIDKDAYDLTHFPFLTRAAVTSSPAIADIDGDANLELVVGCRDGYILVWSIEDAECETYAAPWPMFKHDHQRTAWMEFSP